VKDVLDLLANGVTEADILADFSYLEAEDIRACLIFAAEENRSSRSAHEPGVKFLIDAQLHPGLAKAMRDQGHHADHVDDVGLLRASDDAIFRFAIENGYAIIT
jgi:hypothetical protein